MMALQQHQRATKLRRPACGSGAYGRLPHRVVQRTQHHTLRLAAGAAAAAAANGRLQQVLDGIDALNQQDPRSTTWQGKEVPYEYAYSCWLTDWVKQLEANPSEELLIVARGQHVERWKSPRSAYPEGKAGYLKWREELKKVHAATVVGLMQQAGYPQEPCDKVQRWILKRELKTSSDNQVVEDALCLVFLQYQFADLLAKEGHGKMVDIVRKTWGKMGEKGRAAALQLPLPADQAAVVQDALAPAS